MEQMANFSEQHCRYRGPHTVGGINNIMCPVKLLIHNGLIKGANSIEETLAKGSQRANRTMQWAHPEYPILPSMTSSGTFLDFTKPAGVDQPKRTVKEIGLVAGVLAARDIRRASARDLADLPEDIKGVTNTGIAKALGHTGTALRRGVTDAYVGALGVELYSKKIESPFIDKYAPGIGAPFKRQKVSHDAVTLYCMEHGLDGSIEKNRVEERSYTNKRQEADWLEQQKECDTFDALV